MACKPYEVGHRQYNAPGRWNPTTSVTLKLSSGTGLRAIAKNLGLINAGLFCGCALESHLRRSPSHHLSKAIANLTTPLGILASSRSSSGSPLGKGGTALVFPSGKLGNGSASDHRKGRWLPFMLNVTATKFTGGSRRYTYLPDRLQCSAHYRAAWTRDEELLWQSAAARAQSH